jgi:hypothetical protein
MNIIAIAQPEFADVGRSLQSVKKAPLQGAKQGFVPDPKMGQ